MGIPGALEYLRYMIGYIVLAFILYFLYRFIMGFVVPVVRTANQMKRKVNEMKQPYGQQRDSHERAHQAHVEINSDKKGPFSRFSSRKATGQTGKPSKSDYIEFEEVQ